MTPFELTFLIFTLCWEPVEYNCKGAPDVVSHYLLVGRHGDTAWRTCIYDDGEEYPCPYMVWREVEPWRTYDPAVCHDVDLTMYDLPIGSVIIMPLRVVAVDLAGNRSDEECSP